MTPAPAPEEAIRAAAIAAWNRRAGGEREQQLEAALRKIAIESLQSEMSSAQRYINQDCAAAYDDLIAIARAALAGQIEGERNGG